MINDIEERKDYADADAGDAGEGEGASEDVHDNVAVWRLSISEVFPVEKPVETDNGTDDAADDAVDVAVSLW